MTYSEDDEPIEHFEPEIVDGPGQSNDQNKRRHYQENIFFHVSAPTWKSKLIFWSIIIGSLVLGAFLFLFFLTAFVYLFLPVMAIFFIWKFISRLMSR